MRDENKRCAKERHGVNKRGVEPATSTAIMAGGSKRSAPQRHTNAQTGMVGLADNEIASTPLGFRCGLFEERFAGSVHGSAHWQAVCLALP